MKLKTILFAVLLTICSCTGNSTTAQPNEPAAPVEVMYFHGKMRCATCIAIEEQTQQVIQKHYAEQVADGTLALRIIDLSTKEGKALGEQYEVAFSSLLVVGHNEPQTKNDLTEMAFDYARAEPAEFEKRLTTTINALLP